MKLGFNLNFNDLNSLAGLNLVDRSFLNFLREAEPSLFKNLIEMRDHPQAVSDKDYSNFLTDLSPYVDDFLSILFDIEKEAALLKQEALEFDIIYECKRKFVQRFAVKKYSRDQISYENFKEASNILKELLDNSITQNSFAQKTLEWLKDPVIHAGGLDIAAKYASFMVYQGSKAALFDLPQTVDKGNLITQEKVEQHKDTVRYGFDYFAPELNSENALNHAHYCIYCHNQEKDSCSKGLKNIKEIEPVSSKNGCPLRQKISEMNFVKARGFNFAALGIIVIDNPLVAATGHRICNDCMNSCIYQKQDPVNIPLVESNILDTVLKVPYGVEIYLLLTKWNPLNIYSPLPYKPTGYNVLVVGLGPAGFSLAHYLLNEGHSVVAIDGLKITDLPFDGKLPIKSWQEHQRQLSTKMPQGFGGVAEYGITARWDKNNLTLLRLILERRDHFKIYSGIKFESNFTAEQAFEAGFDHIAQCIGAGEPKMPVLNNFLAKGVRTASDFLMTLQNGGAYLKDSVTSLTLRLPVAIIGCGLTAIDSAVEALNYYPLQVEKFLKSYEESIRKYGVDIVEQNWSIEDKSIAAEFIEHAKLFRQLANAEIRKVVVEELGGVTVCYRGSALRNSQGYKLNPEEIVHAQSAGVKFLENAMPLEINVDEHNYAVSINFGTRVMPAKTIIMAIGTEQNGGLPLDERYSYFGDCDPLYAGSVVKALASSKNGYKNISANLKKSSPNFAGTWHQLTSSLDDLLISTIKKVNILSSDIVELIIYSPLAVKNFRPGQFFRLQNYSADPAKLIEPLALTGAYIDLQNNLISLIILEVGKSSKLCRELQIGEEVALMGPTGEPTQILKNANVMLVGGGLGNAVLFSIGKALRENGCKVTYVAGYKKKADIFYATKIEESADLVIWCCEEELLTSQRPQDISICGTVIDGLKLCADKESVAQIICIGSQSMMQAVKNIKNMFYPETQLICSLNSPMQCMMKGICGQCVQRVNDEREYIFACACQDQDAEFIDFDNLKSRLGQNSLQEKLMALL